MILQWHDPLFWPTVKEYESGFIHKLCVRREFAGKGLSAKMVEHAVRECSRRGIGYLRLDTDVTKPKLCRPLVGTAEHDLAEKLVIAAFDEIIGCQGRPCRFLGEERHNSGGREYETGGRAVGHKGETLAPDVVYRV